VYEQGAALVEVALTSGRLFEGDTWRAIVARCAGGRATLHFIGLLSDGNVHAHIRHLEALLHGAAAAGIARIRVHALLDGRDVPATSALDYVDQLEAILG